jgi:hypothetical protein
MSNKLKAPFKYTKFGSYKSWLSVCPDGYSLSGTPVPGIDTGEVLARINKSQPLTSSDGSFESEIMKTVFNIHPPGEFTSTGE